LIWKKEFSSLTLSSHDHPDFRSVLSNLADAVYTKFQQTGRIADLEQGIQLHRTALVLCPVEHPDKKSSFIKRYYSHHLLGHPDRTGSLNNLAIAMGTRFRQIGRIADFDEGIHLPREVLKLCSLSRN
jgi:hypothetical protein